MWRFAFMDIMPRIDGHTLVIPKFAARNLLDADPEGLGQLIKRVQMIARAAKTALGADGITLQQFNEQAGGQVIFHLHFHILPRWAGVELKPPASGMEKPEVLEAQCGEDRGGDRGALAQERLRKTNRASPPKRRSPIS